MFVSFCLPFLYFLMTWAAWPSYRRFNIETTSVIFGISGRTLFVYQSDFLISWTEMLFCCAFLSGSALLFGSAFNTRAHRKFGFCCYTGTKWLLWVFFIEGTGTFIPLLALDFLPVVMQLDWQVSFNVCRHCHVMPHSVRWSCCVSLCILSELLAVVSQSVVCWSSSAEVCLLLLA